MAADDGGGPAGPFGLLFVCTGNICRSPTAEAYAACAERLDGLVGTVLAALVKAMAVGTPGAT
jgi:Low molecular weight phosphotyrosine protein phosphatase